MNLTAVVTQADGQAFGYPSLFLLVLFGSLVPVVPTGALVSSAGVVASHHHSPAGLVLVFLVASTGAFAGDVALYWLGCRGLTSKNGSRWLESIRGRASEEHLYRAQLKLERHGVLVLVLSRLVPAGRIPVMLACLLSKMPVSTFARGDVPACLSWALAYQLIGILGGSLFPEPWQGVVLAVTLALLVGLAPALWRRARAGRDD